MQLMLLNRGRRRKSARRNRMAKRSKAKRSSGRRRGKFVRKSRRRRGRAGFASRDLIWTTGGVVAGFFVPDLVMRHVPNLPGVQTPTGRIIGKAAIGLGAGYLAKRFVSKTLAGSLTVGALASAAMDFIYQFRGAAGAGAVGTSIATGTVKPLAPTGVQGFIDDQGQPVNGFLDDQSGAVIDENGDTLGYVEDEDLAELE